MALTFGSRLRRGAVLVPVVLGALVVHDTTTHVASAAAGETITGTVFRDADGNGVQNGSETAQSGITVKATDPAGGSVSTTSAANGTFSLSLAGLGPAAGAAYRVEFSIPAGLTYLKPARIPATATVGTTRNGGDVQFVNANATGVTFAVMNPADYCGANPRLITTCFSGVGTGTANRTTLETVPYLSGTTSTTSNANLMNPLPTALQNRNTTGAIGGLAYHRGAQKIFAAAFAKRHTGYPAGPDDNGPDKIYVTNAGSSGAYTTFFTADAGTDVHQYGAGAVNDSNFWDQVGKTAWGNITVSEDDSTLFAINQFDKTFYKIPIINTAGVLTAGTATKVTFPNAATDCGISGAAVNDWAPGAVEQKDGVIYLGITCTGQNQTVADLSKLRSIVYSYTTGATATTKVADFPLNYARGNASTDGTNTIPAAWRNWRTTEALSVPGSPGNGRPYSQAGYPQPWLTGITFDEAHNMVLGFTDRGEHQFGNVNGSGTGSVEGVSAGDTVKLIPNGALTSWTFTAGSTGDEFFNTERYEYAGGGTHQETSLGFVTHLPGSTEIVTNVFDPAPVGGTVNNAPGGSPASFTQSYRSGGLIWMSTTNGDRTRSYQVFGLDESGTFGKVGGIGDVELICELAPIQLGNRIWNDANGNGIQDPGEAGIQNVTVRLKLAGTTVGTATTDASGAYLFGGAENQNMTSPNVVLPNTAYTIEFDNAANYTSGQPLNGKAVSPDLVGANRQIDSNAVLASPGAAIGAGNYPTFSYTSGGPGANDHTLDVGFMPLGTIGDTIFHDYDGDGTPDAGEGVSGVTVTVVWLGPDGVAGGGDDKTYTAVTNASGIYTVTNLPPGNYTVTVDTSAAGLTGLANTTDPDGGNDSKSALTLGVGATNLNQDFGYRGTASIGDFVWYDIDNDGVQDAGEPGIANATVTVLWAGPNGTFGDSDDVSYPTTTDASGIYTRTGLDAGNYRVTVTNSSLPVGLRTQTYDLDGIASADQATTTLSAGQNRTDVDFGYRGTGTIGDTVWHDQDGNGVQGGGELGIANVPVTVRWFGPDGTSGTGDDVVYNRTTDSSGLYLATNLPAGNFSVIVTTTGTLATLGLTTQTYDASGGLDSRSDLTLAAGATNLNQDFGYRGGASLGDFVWFDIDGDGVQDPGEPGLGGVKVTAVWLGPDGVAGGGDDQTFTTTTNSSGGYTIGNLPAGNYTVTVDDTTLPNGITTPTYDLNGIGTPHTTTTTLTTNQNRTDVDFGYRGSGSIGDTIFLDADNNGVPGAGEGLVGVGVTVRWCGFNGTCGDADDVLYPATTGAGGLYLVAGLPAGNYQVDVTTASLPAGVANTVDPFGPKDSHSELSLTLGESNLLQDFGYRYAGAIGDTIFHDQNGTGLPDTGEGLAGVPVTVLWAGPNGTFGDGDDVSYPTVTNAAGLYLVSNLAPGNYRVTVTTTGLIASMTLLNTVDPDATKDSNSALTLGAGEVNLKQDFGYRRKVNDKMYYFSLGGTSGPGSGTGQYDQTVTTLPYTLVDQQLVVTLRNGFVPQVGDTFDILTAPTITGQYAAFYGTIMPNGVVLDVQTLPDRIRLVATKGLFPTSTLDTVDATPGDGTCADSAGECTLRAAVMEANALPGRQSIVLSSGATYALTRTGANEDSAVTGDLDVNQDLNITGAKATIDGAGLGDGVLHLRAGSNDNLSFFTVRNGASPTANSAGGVTLTGVQRALLADLTISGNSGPAAGGIASVDSLLLLYRGSVTGNSGPGAGGVLDVSTAGGNSWTYIERTTIQGNTGGTGGGVRTLGTGTITLLNSAQIKGNGAATGAGAASSAGGDLRLAATTVSGNTATSKGGGLLAEGSLSLDDVYVQSNSAPLGGGLAIIGSAQTAVARVTFESNTASTAGGAVQIEGGTATTFNSSTIASNAAPVGAGVNAVGGSAAQINSVTIAGNLGTGAALNATTGSIRIINSIVADQFTGANCSGTAGQIASNGYSFTNTGSGTACGFGATGDIQGATASLGALANNGGFSRTRKPAALSPVINTGAGCFGKDQRNFDRPRGGACDMGAVEV